MMEMAVMVWDLAVVAIGVTGVETAPKVGEAMWAAVLRTVAVGARVMKTAC